MYFSDIEATDGLLPSSPWWWWWWWSQIAITSSPIVSIPSSSHLNPLDYQAWGKCWSLITSCNRSLKQFPSLQMHFSWFGLPCRRKPLTMLGKTTAICERRAVWSVNDALALRYYVAHHVRAVAQVLLRQLDLPTLEISHLSMLLLNCACLYTPFTTCQWCLTCMHWGHWCKRTYYLHCRMDYCNAIR